jgi:hypothetical protein
LGTQELVPSGRRDKREKGSRLDMNLSIHYNKLIRRKKF